MLVSIVGNLGQDPTVYEYGDKKKVTFSVADKDARGDNSIPWYNVEVWGVSANYAEKYLVKGSTVYVTGTYIQEKYTAKDGTEKERRFIKAYDIRGLSRSENTSQPEETKTEKSSYVPPQSLDDDVPF